MEDTATLPRWKRLQGHIESADLEAIRQIIESLEPEDLRRNIDRLSSEERESLCSLLPCDEAADILEHIPEAQAVEVLEDLPVEISADILEELPAEVSADILREFDQEESEAILAEIDDTEEIEELRERISYAEHSAGGLMSDHVVHFVETSTVAEVLHELGENAEQYQDRDVQYVFVTDRIEKLTGVLALRDLVLSDRSVCIASLMIDSPLSVTINTSLDDLEDIFEKKSYLGLPVIDNAGILKGIVSRESVQEAQTEQQTDDYLKSSGIVGGEELRSMPMYLRCRNRLAWLAPNIVLNLIAVSVIAANKDTIQSVVALAVFLPLVSDMSGCSGNQAIAVSIRELTLGILRPRDYIRVLWKEGLLGLINGIALGVLIGCVVYVWEDGNLMLSAVIACALVLNTIISVLIGGCVPLLLKKFRADPALASGPILTTCTDICGFFIVLTLASMVLDKLVT